MKRFKDGISVDKIRESFKDKKFKYGGYATLMTAIVLAILVVVNLVVDQISFKVDLTQNQIFSLSDQTKQILKNLDQEINIIGLYETGEENVLFDEILQKYRAESKYINIDYVDPVKNPTFSSKYTKDGETLREGSYIVECGDRFKVIDNYDLFNYRTTQYGQWYAESLAVEQQITSAIHYVTAEELPTIYLVTGHLEDGLPYDLRKQLELENYEIEELSLLTEEKVPEDADILMFISPKRDMTEDEAEKVRQYLENKGRAIFFMELVENELPNFEAVLKSYGVGLNKALVIEGDNSRYWQSPAWIIPKLETHDITRPMRSNNMQVVTIGAQGVDILDVKKRTLEIEPLLTTSDNSWGKVDLTSTNIQKEEGDISGPFNIAVTVYDKIWNEKTAEYEGAKLVVVGDAEFLNPQFASIGNADFVLNTLNWLQDEHESISIRPKNIVSEYLNINSFQILLFSGIVVILIPLIILGSGLVVWLRRRHL